MTVNMVFKGLAECIFMVKPHADGINSNCGFAALLKSYMEVESSQ